MRDVRLPQRCWWKCLSSCTRRHTVHKTFRKRYLKNATTRGSINLVLVHQYTGGHVTEGWNLNCLCCSEYRGNKLVTADGNGRNMSVLTVRPFVGDGGDGVVSASILQRVLRRRIVTGWRCERWAGEVAKRTWRSQVATPVLERCLRLFDRLFQLFESGGIAGEAVGTSCGPVTRRAT